MFTDSLSITHSGTGKTLTRKGVTNPAALGLFRTADGLVTIEVRQKSTKARKRSEFVMTVRKIAADPLTAVNSEISASYGIYVDQPKTGFSTAEAMAMYQALNGLSDSGTILEQLINGDT